MRCAKSIGNTACLTTILICTLSFVANVRARPQYVGCEGTYSGTDIMSKSTIMGKTPTTKTDNHLITLSPTTYGDSGATITVAFSNLAAGAGIRASKEQHEKS